MTRLMVFRRKIVVLVATVAVVALAACDTQPATDVSVDAATLHAKGACQAGLSGQWWYQLRNASAGGGFFDVGPRHGYSCVANTGEVDFEAYRVGGLTPGTTYQFRLATTVNGSFYWWDAGGAQNGTNYDSFRTVDITGHQDDAPDPGYQMAPCTPDSPNDACAASNTIRKKTGLRNRFYWELFGGTVSDHLTFHTWSYNLSTKNIRSIDKSDQARCLYPVGSCTIDYTVWRFAECDRTGPDTCLFRDEGQVTVSFTYGIAFNRRLRSCLGTRINWDGSHVRNAWDGSCSSTGTARADFRNGDLVVGKGKNAVAVGRYLSPADVEAFDAACIRETATKRDCKRVALSLYHRLPDRVRKQVGARRS